MTIHAMVDLETLGTDPNSVIISLGAIKFNPYTDVEPDGGLYLKPDIDEQQDLGRTINDNTLEWWSRQDSKVRDEALSDEGRCTLEDMTNQLNKFLVGVDYMWAQGPLFDFVLLENLYKDMKLPTPWNFWQIRDSRTLFSLMPTDPRKEIQQDLHNALADAYYQSVCVQKTYKALGIKGN